MRGWKEAVRVEAEVVSLGSLAEVEAELRAIGVHPGGVTVMAPKGVFRLVRVRQVDPRAAAIIKQEMLAAGGEAAISHSAAAFSPDPSDILLMGTLQHYARLIRKLRRQPWFHLPELAEGVASALERSELDWRPAPY